MSEYGHNRAQYTFGFIAEICGHLGRDGTWQGVGDSQNLAELLITDPFVTCNGFVTDQRNNRRTAAVSENSGSYHSDDETVVIFPTHADFLLESHAHPAFITFQQ
ncbi:hypothetical protein D3C74_372370 [compost metagenome]